MKPGSRLLRTTGALVVGLVLLAACADDDAADGADTPTTTSSTEAGGDATETTEAPAGNPVAEGVVVAIEGALEQTFQGGACVIDQGMLTVNAGFKTGTGVRPQGSPIANGTASLIGPAEEGEHDSGYMLAVVRESDSEVILEEAPSVTIEPGFLSGTFEGTAVSGSFTCPAVLTAEQYNDLVEDYAAG